jgi:hypothetical protein
VQSGRRDSQRGRAAGRTGFEVDAAICALNHVTRSVNRHIEPRLQDNAPVRRAEAKVALGGRNLGGTPFVPHQESPARVVQVQRTPSVDAVAPSGRTSAGGDAAWRTAIT